MKNCFIDHWLLKKVIAESPYALLYIQHDKEGPLGLPTIVKADLGTGSRFLTCTSDDLRNTERKEGRFPVVLRFINRRKGNFIRLQGLATFGIDNKKLNLAEPHVLINLEVVQIAWVYKRTGKVDFFI